MGPIYRPVSAVFRASSEMCGPPRAESSCLASRYSHKSSEKVSLALTEFIAVTSVKYKDGALKAAGQHGSKVLPQFIDMHKTSDVCVCVCVCVHLSHSLVGRNAGGLGVSDWVRRPGRKLVLAQFRFIENSKIKQSGEKQVGQNGYDTEPDPSSLEEGIWKSTQSTRPRHIPDNL